MRFISHIVLHCAAVPQTTTVASVENYWRTQLGWKQPGYHILITPDGVAHRLATDATVCNGVKGHNAHALHVSYIGGVDAKNKPVDNRTPAQRATMKAVVDRWLELYPLAEVLGHRDFPGVAKACPSFDARAWWRAVAAMVVLTLLMLGGTSCSPKLAPPTVGKTVTDSTTVKETVRYVPMVVPGDTVRQVIQLECDPVTLKPRSFVGQADGKGGRASSTVAVDESGKLTVTSVCDALRDSIAVLDREISRMQSSVVVMEHTTTVYRTRWYDKLARWVAGIATLVVGLGVWRRR